MTTHPALTETEVLETADALVDAFRRTDGDAYFACFDEDATFIFPDQDARLENRAAYERLWYDWVASGWSVLECTSSDRRVQITGDTAVFSHCVHTRIATGVTETGAEGTDELHECETIVFHRVLDGRLLAVHEHLSAAGIVVESAPTADTIPASVPGATG